MTSEYKYQNLVSKPAFSLPIAIIVGILVHGCTEQPTKTGRLPKGLCSCNSGRVCNISDVCVEPEDCTDTCADSGWVCGELCGNNCGFCEANHDCESGQCVCQPQCDGTSCTNDGCGGVCPCPNDQICNPEQQCVDPNECTDTCQGSGWSCGTICGTSCGTCGDNQMCVNGECHDSISCSDCPLRLYLLEQQVSDGKVSSVVFSLEYEPLAGQAQPRMADIRIACDQASDLTNLSVGPGVTNADKVLYRDPDTGDTWRKRTDGSYQFLVYSLSNTHSLAPGNLLTLSFSLDSSEPASFWLLRRDQVFAPPEADLMLQMTPFDQPLVVTP